MRAMILWFTLLSLSHAQDFGTMFSPHQPQTFIHLEGMLGDPTREGLGVISQRLYADKKQNIALTGKWRRLGFKDSDSRLANYDDIEGGLSYRRQMNDQRFWSLNASYGSASDEPFKSSDVSVLNSTALIKLDQRWFGILNYSNNRTFANGVPLPGFFFVHTMTREKILIFGLPFAYIKLPVADFSFSYLGILPWRHGIKLTYEASAIKPYFFLEQTPQSFIPYQRTHNKERFFWAKRELGLGLASETSAFKWDVASGLSFAQEFYRAENFGDRDKRQLIRPDNAGFIRVAVRFTIN